MIAKKSILLKISGEVIQQSADGFNTNLLVSIAKQIKELDNYNFNLVIGGGNIFRANKKNELSTRPQFGHYIGMLSTCINGLLIQDIFEQIGIKTELFSALNCSNIATEISSQAILKAKEKNLCCIFSGGIATPFLTTDTTAVLRSLQINADELWKGTKVPGVFDRDPKVHNDANKLHELTYDLAIKHQLKIMDLSAFILAKENNIITRVFNIFEENALLKASRDKTFGSIITN